MKMIQMILIAILISACSTKKNNNYDEFFGDKGEWIPVNSQKNIEEKE